MTKIQLCPRCGYDLKYNITGWYCLNNFCKLTETKFNIDNKFIKGLSTNLYMCN